MRYHWPGNVRELENVLAKASVMTAGGTLKGSDLELPRGQTTLVARSVGPPAKYHLS
jgi:DNA-binding NtrC family response regulator